jgi:DNA-binding transcriptional ArsR family regulator
MDSVVRALAYRIRRAWPDALFEEDGQSLAAPCGQREMSRPAVSKHLRILEAAGSVVSHFEGRETFLHLHPVPIHEIGDRWSAKYNRRRAAVRAWQARCSKRSPRARHRHGRLSLTSPGLRRPRR